LGTLCSIPYDAQSAYQEIRLEREQIHPENPSQVPLSEEEFNPRKTKTDNWQLDGLPERVEIRVGDTSFENSSAQ